MAQLGLKRGIIRQHTNLLLLSLKLVDVLFIGVTGWVAYRLTRDSWMMPEEYLFATSIAMLTATLVFPLFRIYESWRGTVVNREIGTLFIAWSIVFGGLLLIGVATKTNVYFSRAWMGVWFLGFLITGIGYRIILKSLLGALRIQGFNTKTIIVIGCGQHARDVARQVQNSPWAGLQVLGFFDDECFTDRGRRIDGLPILGDLSTIAEFVRTHHVDQVWFALLFTRHHRSKMEDVMFSLRHLTVDVRLVPDVYSDHLLNYSLSEIAGMPVLNINVSPMEGFNVIAKSLEDKLLASIAILLLSPVLIAVAVAVKLSSPGPILFKQLRHGSDGREIEVWKFRSMRVHRQEAVYTQATKGDSRITRIGGFLRRSSLDELPQLFNVLVGSMSMVGPRPHPLRMNEQYMDQVHQYMQRHRVKPGITGWAQVNGYRGETDTLDKLQKRVEFDLYYIENWSIWFDLQILLLTVFRGFVHKNAY